MKNHFTSRGIKYVLEDEEGFCSLYYGNHNTTKEYITDCLMAEIWPDRVTYLVKEAIIYFYISPLATEEEIFSGCLEYLGREEPTEILCRALEWAAGLTDNFMCMRNQSLSGENACNESETAL